MRVAFVVPTLEPSGGIDVAMRHAKLLRERRGWDVGVVVVDPVSRETQPTLRPTEAAATDWDVVVATWWSTWDVAVELSARRHALLLQGIDERFYDWRQPFDRLAASAVLTSAGAIIAVSEHLQEIVAALRPGAEVHVVRNGLDRGTFGSVKAPRDETPDARPLEILIEGQRNLPLKGVDDAAAAVRAMREPARSTLVAIDPTVVDAEEVDRLVGALDPAAMANLYASCDVVLKLSRAEGLGLPPLEAAAAGTPSVVTPYGGHADWLRHGVNGVQVGFDDVPGTAAWLDRLATDRALLARLAAGAAATAGEWPTVEEAADAMAEALLAIASRAPAVAGSADRAVARSVGRNVALGRIAVDRIKREHAERHMELLVSSKTYRLSERMRRAWWHVRDAPSTLRAGLRRGGGRR
jgi:glycosyltransferase involved in cell wall biosynthesis